MRLIHAVGVRPRAAVDKRIYVGHFVQSKESSALRTVQSFVSRAGKIRDVLRFHIDFYVRQSLRRVKKERDFPFRGDTPDFFKVVYYARHVRHRVQRDESGIFFYRFCDVARVYFQISVGIYDGKSDDARFFQCEKGAKYGVVFRNGRYHVVAVFQNPEQDDIYRFGAVFRKNYFVCVQVIA